MASFTVFFRESAKFTLFKDKSPQQLLFRLITETELAVCLDKDWRSRGLLRTGEAQRYSSLPGSSFTYGMPGIAPMGLSMMH